LFDFSPFFEKSSIFLAFFRIDLNDIEKATPFQRYLLTFQALVWNKSLRQFDQDRFMGTKLKNNARQSPCFIFQHSYGLSFHRFRISVCI